MPSLFVGNEFYTNWFITRSKEFNGMFLFVHSIVKHEQIILVIATNLVLEMG